jgi:hypothetical protein
MHAATILAKTPNIDLNSGMDTVRLLAIAALGVALIVVSVAAVFTAGRRGNASKGASIVGTVALCLIPAGLGTGIIAIAFGRALIGLIGFSA